MRMHTSQKFPYPEGLRQIVVCAGLETLNLVAFGSAGSQHDYWNKRIITARSDCSANFKTIHTGKHDVQNEKADPVKSGKSIEHVCTAPIALHYKTFALKVVFD